MHFTLMKKEAAEQQLLLDTSRSVSLPLVVFASLLRAREKYLFRGEGGYLIKDYNTDYTKLNLTFCNNTRLIMIRPMCVDAFSIQIHTDRDHTNTSKCVQQEHSNYVLQMILNALYSINISDMYHR